MKKTFIKFTLLVIIAINVSCSNDDNSDSSTIIVEEPKEYKIEFSGVGASTMQYPLEITYYVDDQSGSLISESVESQTNMDIVEMRNLTSYNKIGFKFKAYDSGEAYINSIIITDIESNEIIFQNFELNINDNKVFMYNISNDDFTIQ